MALINIYIYKNVRNVHIQLNALYKYRHMAPVRLIYKTDAMRLAWDWNSRGPRGLKSLTWETCL